MPTGAVLASAMASSLVATFIVGAAGCVGSTNDTPSGILPAPACCVPAPPVPAAAWIAAACCGVAPAAIAAAAALPGAAPP